MRLIEIVFPRSGARILEPLLNDAAGVERDLGRDGDVGDMNVGDGVHRRDVGARGAFVKSASGGRLDDRQAHAPRLAPSY